VELLGAMLKGVKGDCAPCFAMYKVGNHRRQLLIHIIRLVTTMAQQQRTSHGIREDSLTDEIGLEHLLNHVPLP
jgi:hypothetical protein